MSSSDTHTDGGDSTTSAGFSLTSQIKERFGGWILLMRSSKAMQSNKWRIFHTLTELYMLYCALSIPTLRNYSYGEYGQIIYRVVNFPIHFLLDWIQYESSFIVSGLFMGFLLVAYTLLIVASWSFTRGKGYRKSLRSPLLIIMYICRMFFPTFIYQVIGYMDCSLTHFLPHTTNKTLNRYTSISCTDYPNDILVGVSAIYIIFLFLFIVVSEIVCSDMHPQSKHIFSHCNYWSMIILRMCSFFSIILMFLIPIEFAYLSSIANIILSLASLTSLFKILPFYRTITNSIVFGIYSGTLLSSSATIISFFVNGQFISSNELYNDVGAGLSSLVFVFSILGFFLGLVGLEMYQRLLRRSILMEILEARELFKQTQPEESITAGNSIIDGSNFLNVGYVVNKRTSIEAQLPNSNADTCYQQFMLNVRSAPKKYTKGLVLLLRSDLINNSNYTKDLNGEWVKVHDIVMRISKNILQKGYEDRQIMEAVAMLFAFKHTSALSSLTVAVELLIKSQKLSNFFTYTLGTIKITEIQNMDEASKSDGIISRGYSKLQLIKKNSDLIIALHKDFFKELMNDPIKESNLRSIMNKITELTQSTESIFKQLLSKKSKKVLNMYAAYIELVYFDKETAHTLYLEANSLEENKYMKTPKVKSTKVLPQPSLKDENLSEQGSFQKRVASFSDIESSHHQLLDDVFEESASVCGAGGELKKDYLFRNALKSMKSNTATKAFFIIFLLIGFSIIFGSIGLSVFQGATIRKNIVNLRVICMPQISPISTIRNFRSFQNWINMFALHEYNLPSERNGYKNEFITVSLFMDQIVNPILKNYIEDHVQVLEQDFSILTDLVKLGQSVVFDFSTYTVYGKSEHSFLVPSVNGTDEWSKRQFTGIPEERKVSIIELTNIFLQYMEEMKTNFPVDDLNIFFNTTNQTLKVDIQERLMNSSILNPVNEFSFMLFWINMRSSSSHFENFCTNFMAKSNKQASDMIDLFEYYFICTLCFFVILGLAFLIYLEYELAFLSRLIRVFDKQIGKDVIGKVYQTLSTKSDVEASLKMSIISRIMRSNSFVVVLVISISLVIPLCVGLMFYESRANIKNAMFTYTNVALSSECLQYLQLSSFYLTELMTYFALPTLSYNTMNGKNIKYGHPFLNEYDFPQKYLQIRRQSDILSANWNELIYGDVNKPDNDPVIGLYPVLDSLLVGVSNCSLYLEQRNLNSTYENYLEHCAGIESMVTSYLTKTAEVSELTRDHFIEQMKDPTKLLDPLGLYLQHNDLFRMSIPLTKKLQIFVDEFVRVSSELSVGFLIGFSLFGFAFSGFLSYILFRVLNNSWDSLHKTRMMLNYIALDNIDRNETLRNLVLYHSYPNVVLDKMIHKKRKQGVQSNITGLTEMINKHIDGTILISQLGDIESMNNAAHRMFGSKSSDYLGAHIYKLFEEKSIETVKKTVESMIEASKKSNDSTSMENRNLTETLEVDCLRLNQTKFPSKISFFSMNIEEKGLVLVCTIKDITSETKQKTLLEEEKKNSEALLKNILPEGVAARLKKGETFIAEKLNDITCFFSDMVGFTNISSNMQATDLVKMLNYVVNGFDNLTEKYDLEKIKTIGDAYFVTGGLKGSSDHPENMMKFAIETFDVLKEFNQSGNLKDGVYLNIRIGINTGACVAGVIGTKKFAYDLWGDTINTASRMESTGVPGRVQISRSTYERVFDLGLKFEERKVEVKGKGLMQAYLLNAKHHTNPVPDLVSIVDNHVDTTTNDYENDDLTIAKIPQTTFNTQEIQQEV